MSKAPLKRPAKAPPPATMDELHVSVRMYRSIVRKPELKAWLGDCFLIRLRQGEKRSNILIDCGVLLGSDNAKDRMKSVAADIVKECGGDLANNVPGKLDLLVVTHEHWDHISGFAQAADVFFEPSRLKIENLWMAWTEADGVDAKKVKDRRSQGQEIYTGLVNRAAALAAKRGQGNAKIWMEGFNGPRDFSENDQAIGAAADKKHYPKSGPAIMEALKKRIKSVKFLTPGQQSDTTTSARETPGSLPLPVHVLGPPRNLRRLFKDQPSKKEGQQETYLAPSQIDALAPYLVDSEFFLAMARKDWSPGDSDSPFAAHYRAMEGGALRKPGSAAPGGEELTQEEKAVRNWIVQHYVRNKRDPEAKLMQQRRIDGDWLDISESLALKLDRDTNNTSLVLAFELPDESFMLFAADAQVGNWESWHDQDYEDAKGKELKAEDILNRTRFYKVGHHGSHNATLKEKGLEMMKHDDLVAAISTDEAQGKRQSTPWQMPNPRVNDRLKERTKGRIMRSDRLYNDADKAHKLYQKPFPGLTSTDLYLEYQVYPPVK